MERITQFIDTIMIHRVIIGSIAFLIALIMIYKVISKEEGYYEIALIKKDVIPLFPTGRYQYYIWVKFKNGTTWEITFEDPCKDEINKLYPLYSLMPGDFIYLRGKEFKKCMRRAA